LIVAPCFPLEVHTVGVVVMKVTGNPDDAVAVTVSGDVLNALSPMGEKVIVCPAFVTPKLRVTDAAGL
jgi:hypothetical protein